MLTGLKVTGIVDALEAAKELLNKGCKNCVVITLGSQGAMFLEKKQPNKPIFVPAPKVQAVDTTVSNK